MTMLLGGVRDAQITAQKYLCALGDLCGVFFKAPLWLSSGAINAI
jgi:hypothetical protein